jgi:antitoxin MazE
MLKLILLKNFGNLDFCNYFVNTNTHMEISVISIGNSKGIRLSKTVLEKYNIQDSLELILEKNYIILKPKTSPRKGWDKAFKKMHEAADDQLLLPDVFTEEDFESWS